MTPGKVICLDFVQAEQPVLWTVLVVNVFPMVDAVLAVTRAKRSKSGGHLRCGGTLLSNGRKIV